MKFRNFRITDSNVRVAGLGLFNAYKPIERNTIITPFTGIESTTPINGNYVLKVNKRKFINANRSIDIAGFANDCRPCNRKTGECQGNNAKFTFNRKTNAVNLVSTKRISPKVEIFAPYSRGYWKTGRTGRF